MSELETLNLDTLQNWINTTSPVFIDLSNCEHTILSNVESGIAGLVRTILDDKDYYGSLTTSDYRWENSEVIAVEISFIFINKTSNECLNYKKWFTPTKG